MNDYQEEIEGMRRLLDCCGDEKVEQLFQKKTYSESFQRIYQEQVPTFDAIEKGYSTAADGEQFLAEMADALTAYASEKLEGCTRKSRKERLQMDLNLTMAVYVLPMVLEFHGESSEPLVRKLTDAWKNRFPRTNLQAAQYKTIEEGFHKTWCYITTAVCHTFGKSDDCYELTVLRNYRDSYLADAPGGQDLIREYYDVAPSIVKHIEQQSDSDAIYRSIWERWLAPCIAMIETGEYESCREHYTDMVHTLHQTYFYKRSEA